MVKEKKVAFIGAGVVGTSLACFLARDFELLGFYSRSFSSAQKAVEKAGSGKAQQNLFELTKMADIIFITTPDDAISKIAEILVENSWIKPGATVIHTSGALSSDILRYPSGIKYNVASLHPLQSFADVEKAVQDLPRSIFTVEGDQKGCKVAEKIVEKLGAEYFCIQPDAKSLYHAAACVASNYLVTLLDFSLGLNEMAGIPREKAFQALKPLIKGTLKNIEQVGTVKGLTGPVSRGDLKTIENHLKFLPDDKKSLYCILGKFTADLAQKKGSINKEKADKIRSILNVQI